MKTVEVKASNVYPVFIGSGLLKNTGELLKDRKKPCRVALVTDKNTERLFGNVVRESLERAGFETASIAVLPGEGSKSWSNLERILEFMADTGLDRTDLIVALGGGTVGDIAGFAASVYLRGIDYIQIPTTFLAAIDSSVGGKTAVNLKAGKNLAGTFYQPLAVLCDCDVFKSLPEEILADGMAEAVKYGVLAGENLFSMLIKDRSRKNGLTEGLCSQAEQQLWMEIAEIVERCVRIKAGLVEQDQWDRGERRLLNLGHTIGHSVEVCSGYTVSHGKAVSIGLAILARASERTGYAGKGLAEAICAALEGQGLPTETEIESEALYRAALSDKKREGNSIFLVMPRAIGDCRIEEISFQELKRLIELGRRDNK